MSELPVRDPRRAMRVLVVHADRRVRRDLTELLALRPGVEVVATAADSLAARAALAAAFDVVVLDPRLPHVEDGLTLIALLRRQSPARIVVLSHDAALRQRALAHGADAFLTEADRPAALVDAVAGQPADPQEDRGGGIPGS